MHLLEVNIMDKDIKDVRVFNEEMRGWIKEINERMVSGALDVVFVKRINNAYIFSNLDQAKKWVDRINKESGKIYDKDGWRYLI